MASATKPIHFSVFALCLFVWASASFAQPNSPADGNFPAPFDQYGNGGGVRGFMPAEDIQILEVGSRAYLPAEFQDAGFEPFVRIALVAEAVSSRNASVLADIALQLAEGERILLREHHSGINSSGLFEKALRVAVETGDKGTVERLTVAAEKLGNTNLKAQLQTLKLTGASRVSEPEILIDVTDVDEGTFALIQGWREQIKTAALLGDGEQLTAIESELKNSAVPEGVSISLGKSIEIARKSLPESTTSADQAIAKLFGESRKGPWYTRPEDWGEKGVIIFKPQDDGGGTAGWDTETSTGYRDPSNSVQTDSNVKRRFTFILWNSCPRAIIHVRLPGNKTDQLSPGVRRQYTFSGNSRDATIYVYNSKKSYNLRPGTHKFWWTKDDRVGLDLDVE